MDFQPFDWKEIDVGYKDKTFQIVLFGYTKNNEKMTIVIKDWEPYFYLHVKGLDDIPSETADKIISEISTSLKMKIRYKIEKRTEIYYANGVTRDLIKVFFKSKMCLKKCYDFLQKNEIDMGVVSYDIDVIEHLVPHVEPYKEILQSMKLQEELGITYTSWIKVDDLEKSTNPLSVLPEYLVSWKKIKPSLYEGSIKPSILFYDLETYCEKLYGKPGEPTKHDMIFMNGILFRDEKENITKILQIVGKKCKDVKIDGVEVKFYSDDEELILDFCNIINKLDPTIISGYNIFNFDNYWLNQKLTKINKKTWKNFSRLRNYECLFKGKKWSSSAKSDGGVTYRYVDAPGRLWIDLYLHIKNNYVFKVYKLDAVLQHFLGKNKVDFRYELINMTCRICNDKKTSKYFPFYKLLLEKINELTGKKYESTKEITTELCDDAMTACGIYCMGDINYLPELFDKISTFTTLSEEANIMGVTIAEGHTAGQGIKIFPSLYRMSKKKGFYLMLPEGFEKPKDVKTKGGNVLDIEEPIVEEYIATLDFASLYPSIMIAKNICYSTEIRPEDKTKYDKVIVTEWDEEEGGGGKKKKKKKGEEVKMIHKSYSWRGDRIGVIPAIEIELKERRKQAKKLAGSDKKPRTVIEQIYHIRQNTLKVLMNAIYGTFLVKNGGMCCLHGGDAICGMGRQAQALAIEIAAKAGWTTFYGDTDSIFIRNKKIAPKDTFAEAEKIAKEITSHFEAPMELIAEKVIRKGYFYKSKNYIYTLMDDEDPEKIDLDPSKLKIAGLRSRKRDTIPLAGQCLNEVIIGILKGISYKQLRKGIYGIIDDMYKGKYDNKLTKLMIISKMPNQYKSVTYQGRLFVEGLIKDGYDPELGERLETWYVENDCYYKGEKLKTKEQMEKGKLKIDYDIYEELIYKAINPHIIHAKD